MQKRLLADASANSNDVQIQINIQVIDLYCKTICKLPQTCQNFLITFICQTEYLQSIVNLPVLSCMLCNSLCKSFRTTDHSPVAVHLCRILRLCAYIAVFACGEMISAEKLSVEDDPACNTGSDNNNSPICTALKTSSPELGKCRTFSIIFHRNRNSVTLGKFCTDSTSCKICKISCCYAISIPVVQHTRHADGNTFNAVFVFLHNTVQNCIIVLFCLCMIVRCGNLIFFKNFCIFVH